MKQGLQWIFIIFIVIIIVQFISSIRDLRSRDAIVQETKERLQKAQQEHAQFQDTLTYVESPAFVEQEARDKLNMGRPGEIVAIIPQPSPTPTPSVVVQNKENWELWMEAFRVTL